MLRPLARKLQGGSEWRGRKGKGVSFLAKVQVNEWYKGVRTQGPCQNFAPCCPLALSLGLLGWVPCLRLFLSFLYFKEVLFLSEVSAAVLTRGTNVSLQRWKGRKDERVRSEGKKYAGGREALPDNALPQF